MKQLIFLLIFSLFVSCNSTETVKEVSKVDSIIVENKIDSATSIKDSHYFWTADQDAPKGLVMKKTWPLSKDSLTVPNLINLLNQQHQEIVLVFSKISGDSIFVKINKSNHLTQQMGSSGAEAYLAEVTYNLTELNGINFVDIRFKEGDHAQPGIYSRTDFVDIK